MISRNDFEKLKWWEKIIFCCFAVKEATDGVEMSIVAVPLLVSCILNSCGIYGEMACAIALGFLAVYTIIVCLSLRYYNKHFASNG